MKKMKKDQQTFFPVSIGEKVSLFVESLTQQGQGVGRIEQFTVFVDEGIPGDEVLIRIIAVKKSYAVGKILNILSPSGMRIRPLCPYYENCGGCQLQHMNYASQLQCKKKMVVDALQRIGGISEAEKLTNEVLGMAEPWRYRNKAQFKLNERGVGFYTKNSHDIIPIEDCLNQPESCANVIKTTNALVRAGVLKPYDEASHGGSLRGVVQRSNRLGEEMLTLILKEGIPELYGQLAEAFRKSIPNLVSLNININNQKGNHIFGQETFCIWGEDTLTEKLDGLVFQLSPRAFFQVNTAQAEVLYRQVKAFADLDGTQVIYDLFCGTGTIGLYLAKNAKKVVGIEIIGEAVENAGINAKMNGIENAIFYEGKAEELFEKAIHENGKPDLLVVDPPRKGLEAHIIDLLDAYQVPRVIYVSCNPATLARDLALMKGKGYQPEMIQPVDLFPHTGHVESVVLMSRITK